MIFLYTVTMFFLGATKWLINRRVAVLERKYVQTVETVDGLLRQVAPKNGKDTKLDVCRAAKAQVALGLMTQRQDRLEMKYEKWQDIAKKFNDFVARVHEWKGRKLPYTMGVLDVSAVLYGIDYFGVGQFVNARQLGQWLVTLFNG
jgi:hypothetical protein